MNIRATSLVGSGFLAAVAVAVFAQQPAASPAPGSNSHSATTHVQHLAVRVSNLERSSRFYTETFRAKVVVQPYLTPTAFAEAIMGIPGASYRASFVQLPDGFIVELFQFVSPAELVQLPNNEPTGKGKLNLHGFLHFAIQVPADDFQPALARAVAAGGSVPPPPPQSAPRPARGYGSTGARYAYVYDPDGNIIELNDTSKLVTEALQMFEMHPDPARP